MIYEVWLIEYRNIYIHAKRLPILLKNWLELFGEHNICKVEVRGRSSGRILIKQIFLLARSV